MSTTGEMLKNGSLLAATSLAAYQHRFVKVGSTGVTLTGANGAAHGILLNTPAAAEPCELCSLGYGKITLGGTVTKGDFVKSDANGKAVTASAADRIAGYVTGYVTEGGDANELVQMFFTPNATSGVGTETLTGAGALSASVPITEWVATSDAGTLADGLYVGFIKTIRAATGTSGTNTLTPATVSADAAGGVTPSTFTITDAGQEIVLEWLSDGWKVRSTKAAGVAAVADLGTANLLHSVHTFAVSGTDTVTLPDGWYPGQTFFGTVISAAATPISVMSGKFYDEDGSADGITATANPADVSDQVIATWSGARWMVMDPTYVVAP